MAAGPTPADRAAGQSLDHVIVRFHTGALARAGFSTAALGAGREAALGLPAGARLEASGFARWRSGPAKAAAEALDARDWMYCTRPATQSVSRLLAVLRANPLVDYAEPDFVGTGGALPTDPDFTNQWHLLNRGATSAVPPDIRASNAWALTTGSTNVILAVLDTGIATGVVEFTGRLVPGYDFVNSDANPSDDQGHGTAVAGFAAAGANNGAVGAGVDWRCRIRPVKVLDASNSGLYSTMASGIDYAVAQGAHVINFSIGGSSADVTLSNAIMNAIAAGVVFVTITHNDSSSTVRFPGRMLPCITVGATTSNDQRSSFSNYGPSIDLCAPGSSMHSVTMAGLVYVGDGTSFAAPLVAGTACLLRSIKPDLNQESARAILCASADDQVGKAAEDTAGFDSYHGWGRLNAGAALQLAAAAVAATTNGAAGPALVWQAPANAAQRWPFRIEAAASLTGPWTTAAPPTAITYGGGLARWEDVAAATSAGPRFIRLAVVPP